jgi:hypothetical protein
MTTCTFEEDLEAAPPCSPWVRLVLVLGHLAIVVGLLAILHSPRPVSQKAVSTGPSILGPLRGGDETSIH